MSSKQIFDLKIILFITFLLCLGNIKSNDKNNFNKYFFTIYPSNNSQTPYILHADTPFKQHLRINCSETNTNKMIKKEAEIDYTNANISSIFFYENEYMIKTCFGSNKIVQIISLNEIDSSTSNNYVYQSDKNISTDFIYCYSTIINNPNSKNKNSKVIISYWVEKLSNKNEYSHKSIFFYLDSKKFSQTFTLGSSSSLFHINKKYPTHCTTFREKDIFCSYYDEDLNNQFVIETNKLISNSKSKESIYFVLSDFGQIKGNNMKPIALNKQIKSLFGGYYDVFLAEFHNNMIFEKNSTVLLYSLYRKSLHASIVPMFANLELFFGTNIKDAYVEINLFNMILEGKEMILFFIYKNHLRVARIDYSVENNLFKSFSEIENLGYYSAKLENCKIPKYMQSTYITNIIKYNSTEQEIVNKNKNYYVYEQDIALLLSCSNSDENDEEVTYNPIVIQLPQCLNYLDSLNGNNIHKINFFLNVQTIIYDVYRDPPLKPFRNVGIVFYPYENYYLGLLFLQIKLKNSNKYIVPKNNVKYEDITHIRFERYHPRFVPIFRKPFYLKYRLFNKEDTNSNVNNKLASNICFFQIKFFPYNSNYYSLSSIDIEENPSTDTTFIEPYGPEEEESEICDIDLCAICTKEEGIKGYTCQVCDTSELEVIIRDNNKESDTYGKCICDVNLHFYKDPIENTCACQEDYAYYKTTNLCWPLEILENGPYYIKAIDDITDIPIYDDCYYSCKKCSEAGDAKNNNCEECKDGFTFIDDEKNNCVDENEIGPGYHEEGPDQYIKCHDNCISCSDKPLLDANNNTIKQYCTECKSYVPYFIRENPDDEYFNCFATKCDENVPSLLFAYSEHSYECLKNCDNGVKPYNNSKVCLRECNNDFPFLEKSTKKCYTSCELNDVNNKISDIDKGICTNECKGQTLPGNKCSECKEENMYRNKDGNCVKIPIQCQIIDVESGLCKVCNIGYYPLKEDMGKNYFNCYKNLEEIIEDLNRTDFYLNETEKYWDECYDSCESCYAYGSENRQRCKKCKYGYHFEYYFENIYNNCRLNLTPNENCTSSQAYMYKYKDFCHLCKEGYSFAYGTDICLKTEELEEKPFYVNNITIKTGENKTEETEVKIYYPCYKLCKKCKEKGDYYDNKCTSCIDGYHFDKSYRRCILESEDTEKTNEIIIPSTESTDKTDNAEGEEEINGKTDLQTNAGTDKQTNEITELNNKETDEYSNIPTDKDIDTEDTDIITNYQTDKNDKTSDYINHEDEIEDNDENIWFKLGDNSFYFYKQKNCLIIFYDKRIFLVSNKDDCINVCQKWDRFNCKLKNYTRFSNMEREEYDNLVEKAYEYDSLRNNVNLVLNVPEKNLYFHLTNYVSNPEKNLSYINISKYQNQIFKRFNSNILLMKVDIKRSDTQSTQVEYQYYNPNSIIEKINLKNILFRRRLENNNTDMQLNIDLPVDWTKDQLEKIEYLDSKDIDAFNSSSAFYIDNCNQFTSAKGDDVFLKDRKKIYYPDIPLCEKDCTFVKYNSDTQKVTCQCNYKSNSDNFQNVTFVTKPVDKKFLKDIFLENFQTMKCIKLIFKWENLKSNAGFIIMILFIFIFVGSFIFYFLSGGFLKIPNFTNKIIHSQVIKEIIEKSESEGQSLQESPEEKPGKKVPGDDENDKPLVVKIFVDSAQKPKKDLIDEEEKPGNNTDKNSDKHSNSSSEKMSNKTDLIDDDGKSKKSKDDNSSNPKNNKDTSSSNGDDKSSVDSKDGNKNGKNENNNDLLRSGGLPAESVNEFIRKDSQNSKSSKKKDNDNQSQISGFAPQNLKSKKYKRHNEDKVSDYSELPNNRGDYDDDSRFSGDKDYIGNFGKDKLKRKMSKNNNTKNDKNNKDKRNNRNDSNNQNESNKNIQNESNKNDANNKNENKKNKQNENNSQNDANNKNEINNKNESVAQNKNKKNKNQMQNSSEEQMTKNNEDPNKKEEKGDDSKSSSEKDKKGNDDKDINNNKNENDENKRNKKNKIKKSNEDKMSKYSELPNKRGDYDDDSKFSGDKDFVGNYGKNKLKKGKNSDQNLIDDDSQKSDKNSNNIGNKNGDNNNDNKNQDEKSMNSSIEFPVHQINNPLLDNSKFEENPNNSKTIDMQNENNISNLNINNVLKIEEGQQNQNEKEEIKEEDFKEEDIKEEDIKSQDKSLISSEIAGLVGNKDKKDENKKENEKEKEKEKKLNRQNSDISGFSIEPQKVKNYDKDSDIYSVNSDLISNYSKVDLKSVSGKGNPPKRGVGESVNSIDSDISKAKPNKNKTSNKNNKNIMSINLDQKNKNENKTVLNNLGSVNVKHRLDEFSSTSKPLKKRKKSDDEYDESDKYHHNKFGKIGEIFQEKFGFMNEAKITDELLKKNIELLTLEEFRAKYNTFELIYLEDLRKHHLIYFAFFACNDNNNLFLKLAFFSLTINLYFGLNTMLIFDSNMSDAYYDKKKAKLEYILMNLFLPYIICGLTSFIIKILVMPSYCINKMIRKIQNNENLKNMILNGNYLKPEEVQIENKGRKKHNIKNKKITSSLREYIPAYQEEIEKLEKELGIMSSYHFKKVLIFFAASSIVLAWNWYLMTSFCAIFRNTGVKLIVNSVVSLLASWTLPFIFGLLPSAFGNLAVRLNSRIIYRIYQAINTIL